MSRPASVLAYSDDLLLRHDPGRGHPESPARLRSILEGLAAHPIPNLDFAAAAPAQREAILRIHAEAYVAQVDALKGMDGELDADTRLSKESVYAAYQASGCAIQAVTTAVEGETPRAFALLRPPGHHAERSRGMGFCIFNHIAIASAHARARLGVHRVLIVDWDVHHGNGTMHSFYDRKDVLVCNLHQSPFYPGTGAIDEIGIREGEGYSCNVPLPAGAPALAYHHAFDELILPIAESYAPELILVSAGFDAHEKDPLGSMRLTESDYAWMTRKLRTLADSVAEGRLVLFLEGGYDTEALERSVRSCLQELAAETEDEEAQNDEGWDGDELEEASIAAVAAAKARLAPFWPVLR